ncbi:hypothetical protein RAO00_01880 [Ornithobacterium rhinotracheale]|uniref:hypothetical protein n=1 Tax=Ornithobacterium rhinotracheale TaxID=28251 RepID=UPI0038731D94
MKELITKVDSFLLKPLSGNGAGTSIANLFGFRIGSSDFYPCTWAGLKSKEKEEAGNY